jgi:hypothetical protein
MIISKSFKNKSKKVLKFCEYFSTFLPNTSNLLIIRTVV